MHYVIVVFVALLRIGIHVSSAQRLGAKCAKDGRWVGWFDVDSPVGDGDYETLPNIRKVYGIDFCRDALDISVREAESKAQPTEVISFDAGFGMTCLTKHNNGTCKNYEVAFCCPGVTGNPNMGRSHVGYECLLAKTLAENGIPWCTKLKPVHIRKPILTADSFQCTDPCDESSEIISIEDECGNYSHCRWEDKKCKSNRFSVIIQNEDNVRDFTKDAISSEVKPTVEGRLFGNNQGPVPPFPFPPGFPFPYQAPSFPENCGINYDDTSTINSLIQPPINIPYCYRVPCSTSDQSLEFNRVACHNQPGCYFDLELYNLRGAGGYSILSGVPVCHEVIRHKNFAKAAIATIAKSGKPWSGIHTNCLIQQNPNMFDEGGCDGLQIMLYFQAPVKQLGWPGITKKECKIMGGCFFNSLCYYPPSSNQIQLRAGEDPYRSSTPTGRDLYGQPQCLPFDPNGTPSSILNSYHACRMAGCVMDPSYDSAKIRSYLCDIVKSETVPVNLKKPFWDQVLQGIVGPHNWQQVLRQLVVNVCPNPYANNPLNSIFQNSGAGRFPILQGCTSVLDYFGINNPNPSFTTPNPLDFVNSLLNNYNGGNGGAAPFPVPGQLPPNFPSYQQPQCPFQPYVMQGYNPLQGRFDGCCERHYCYVPRAQARSVKSGVSLYFTFWSNWGACSATCGGGTRKQTRTCVANENQGGCEGSLEKVEVCGEAECPYWGSWGPWGTCSKECGGGQQTRSRQCLPSDAGCSGPGEENQNCNDCTCPTFSKFTPWTSCTATVGCGTQTRDRTCTDAGTCPTGCNTIPTALQETKPCKIYCGSAVETGRSTCTGNYWDGCFQTVTKSCLCGAVTPDCDPCHDYEASTRVRCQCRQFFGGK